MNKKKPLKTQVRRTNKKAKKSTRPFIHALKYLPALLLFTSAVVIHQKVTPHRSRALHNSVLSYATSISSGELLAQTNAQRTSNGVAALGLNGQLTNAAQAKANDMVARNYWSHNTPDGDAPWVFIANAGYNYQTAGENLAYGFDTSSETVTGWMNSPPHRENLLNSAFSEVGFGFSNSPDFINDGQQTVVVAMYGAPVAQPAPSAPVVSNSSNNTPAVKSASNQQNDAPVSDVPTETPQPTATQEVTPIATTPVQAKETTQAVASVQPKTPQTSSSVRKIQLLTGGNARWSGTLLVTSMCGVGIFWALERRRQLKHFALASEHFIIKHLHIDLAVAAFITLGLALLETSGLVR